MARWASERQASRRLFLGGLGALFAAFQTSIDPWISFPSLLHANSAVNVTSGQTVTFVVNVSNFSLAEEGKAAQTAMRPFVEETPLLTPSHRSPALYHFTGQHRFPQLLFSGHRQRRF